MKGEKHEEIDSNNNCSNIQNLVDTSGWLAKCNCVCVCNVCCRLNSYFHRERHRYDSVKIL